MGDQSTEQEIVSQTGELVLKNLFARILCNEIKESTFLSRNWRNWSCQVNGTILKLLAIL